VHVNTIMWRVVFKELRGLTNSKGLELNPMELNGLYENLYDLGIKLQGDASMDVFEDSFRPWPHVYKNKRRSEAFYDKIDCNLADDLKRIRNYNEREDSAKYVGLLRKVLQCFGEGIIQSLEFTMKNYLEQTDGKYANGKSKTWEKDAVNKMFCHNNHAERPFAVLKAFAKMYPSLSLRNLSRLVHSLVNGTHRCAETFGARGPSPGATHRLPGIALTAHPAIRAAVNKLCSIRKKSLGEVTLIQRVAYVTDKKAQVANRKLKGDEKFKANIARQATIAANRNKAEDTASNSLCTDLLDLQNQLLARCNSKDARLTFLKDQVYARIAGEKPRLYPGLGQEWRKIGGKIRVSAKDKHQSNEDYLTKLVTAMLIEDGDTLGVNNSNAQTGSQDYIRALPSICLEYTNPKALAWKQEFAEKIATLATPKDDPLFYELQEKYVGQLLYDNDTRASQKLFRIVAIQFVRSYSSTRHSCWEATCEPVYHESSSGQYIVPVDKKVEGSNVILANALQGYALNEFSEGTDSDATHLPWVDKYIQHFIDVIAPMYDATTTQASLSLTSPPASRARSRRNCS